MAGIAIPSHRRWYRADSIRKSQVRVCQRAERLQGLHGRHGGLLHIRSGRSILRNGFEEQPWRSLGSQRSVVALLSPPRTGAYRVLFPNELQSYDQFNQLEHIRQLWSQRMGNCPDASLGWSPHRTRHQVRRQHPQGFRHKFEHRNLVPGLGGFIPLPDDCDVCPWLCRGPRCNVDVQPAGLLIQ